MALQFTTTKEAAVNQGIKVLVYGKAGAGKTRLCATAPAPLIISAEAGLLSLRGEDIPVIEITSMDDLDEAFNWVSTNKKASQFQTICIDSLSEIGEIVLTTAKRQVKDARQAYGELIDKMMDTVKKFRDLQGKNVYFSTKEEKLTDTITNTVLFQPNMPGTKLGPQLPYYFDEVFNLNFGVDNNGQQTRFLRTAPNFQYEAKDRSGALNELEPPDLTTIFNKIKGTTNERKKNG